MTGGQYKDLLARIKQLECCCGSEVGFTSGVPTSNPGNNARILIDPDTGIAYYWDGNSWEILTHTAQTFDQIGIKIDGGGAEIIAGYKDRFRIHHDWTIIGWVILETSETPIAGDIEIDVAIGTYADYDTTPVFATIIPMAPSLSADVKNQATGLSIDVSDGDIVEYTVTSAATVEIVQLYLIVQQR